MTTHMQSLSPLIHLIDDDAAVRDGLALLISTVGLRVQTWAAPEAFMREFDRASIGAIVLDVRMPGINGLTVLDTLIREGVDQPIIMLTGHGTVEMCRRAFKSGAAEFLEKPVDDEVLLEALQNAVRQHVRSRERNNADRESREHYALLSERDRARTRSARAHRRWPNQQRNRPRPHTVAPHRRNASREFVCKARGGIAGGFDSAVCGVGGGGVRLP